MVITLQKLIIKIEYGVDLPSQHLSVCHSAIFMIFGHFNRAVSLSGTATSYRPRPVRRGESGSEFDTTGPALTRSARPGDRPHVPCMRAISHTPPAL